MSATITTQPGSQKCLVGSSAIFAVIATGSTSYTYQWYKDGVSIAGKTSSTLAIDPVSLTYVGDYTVKVTGADLVSVTSSVAKLEVSGDKGLIPVLTSNTSQAGYIASASSEASSSAGAWRAFDRTVASADLDYISDSFDSWVTLPGNTTGWLMIQLPSPAVVRRYQIYPARSATGVLSSPSNWTLFGSLDGFVWTYLDSRSNVTSWAPGIGLEFIIASPAAYSYYRLAIGGNQGGNADTIAISEWLLYSTVTLNVAVTLPVVGDRLTASSVATVTAVPTVDQGQSVVSVDFFANSTSLGQATSSPFTLSWTPTVTGVYQIVAVATNSLGEAATSPPVQVAVEPEASTAAPTVILSEPIDGANFQAPANVDIMYLAVPGANAIDYVTIYVDGVELVTLDSASGTYTWHIAVANTYAIQVVATDTQSLTGASETSTVTVAAAASEFEPLAGSLVTLTTKTSQPADITDGVSYVWKFWDHSAQTTAKGAVQKILTDSSAEFTASVFDAYGRQKDQVCYGLNVKVPPKFELRVVAAAQQVLPYYTEITLLASTPGSFPVFTWRDSIGAILSSSDPSTDHNAFTYSHKVTTLDEVIYLTVAVDSNHELRYALDFALPGKLNKAPVLAQFVTGSRPKAWGATLAPVYCATTIPLTRLCGQLTVDSAAIPPTWALRAGSYTKLAAARVLVKNQPDPRQNGVYIAATTRLAYTSTLSGTTPAARYLIIGSNELRFSATDRNDVSVAAVIADHLAVGRNVLVTSGVKYYWYSILAVSAITGGTLATVSLLESSGTIGASESVSVDFGWHRSTDAYSIGTVVPVAEITGLTNLHGGDYFAVIGDALDNTITIGVDPLYFSKCNIEYSGSAQSKSQLYVDLVVSELNELNCSAVLELANYAGTQALAGQETNLVRTKLATNTLAAGSYDLLAAVVNQSTVTGFEPATSAAKATIDLVAQVLPPPRPYSAATLARIAAQQAALSNAPGSTPGPTSGGTSSGTPTTTNGGSTGYGGEPVVGVSV